MMAPLIGQGESRLGVYYRYEDYAGVWRRLFVEVVDSALLLFGIVSVVVLVTLTFSFEEKVFLTVLFLSAFVLGFACLVLLKSSRWRTVWYILGRVRIVNLQGEHPSIWALAVRALFGAFGPLNPLLDLLWIPSDGHRQALRDKFAHTYVINVAAQPVGTGRIRYTTWTLLTWNFIFPEVTESQAVGDS